MSMWEKIKSRLVADWRDGWKWYSTRSTAIVLALPVAWNAIPSGFQDAIPGGVVTCMAAVAMIGQVGRFIDQPVSEESK